MGRAFDWLRQAERDLQQALSSEELGYYEWACFASHQVADGKSGKSSTPLYGARSMGGTWWQGFFWSFLFPFLSIW